MRPPALEGVVLVLLVAGTATANAIESPRALSAMAYNVRFDATDLDATLKTIDRADPDLLCLAELTPTFARAFDKRFGDRFPFRSFGAKSGTWGVGIASRFPLQGARTFRQRPHRMPAMEAQVTTNQGRFQVACLHLFPPVAGQKKGESVFDNMEKNAELRKKQVASVVRRYANTRGPVLILGDMNEGPEGSAMRRFSEAGFRRACEVPEQRCGPTFPGATSVLPAVWEIDHILGRRIRFETARVIKAGGSDHFPVFATFVLSMDEPAQVPPSSPGSSRPAPPPR